MSDLKVTGQYDAATGKIFQGSTVALPPYTLAQIVLVAASPDGLVAYVSDANGGLGAVVYSDGLVWRDVRTNVLVV